MPNNKTKMMSAHGRRTNIVLAGRPQPKQMDFFRAEARYVAYGGARGGGKSWALRRKLLLMCARYAGLSVLLVRRTYAEVRDNHLRPLLAETKDFAVYTDSRKTFEFRNGSRLRIGFLDNEMDALQYQGQEYDVIALDEATQLTEYQFQSLKGCLRGANAFPKRMFLTCNPGGVGHGWVKRLFIDRDYRENEDPAEYAFIPASIYDNPILLESDPGYLDRLKSLPKGLREAWLDGSWDSFEGQFFREFDPDRHTADTVELVGEVRRYCAIDYGLDMLAAVFVAVDEKGRALVYDEVHESNLIVSDAARAILAKARGVSFFFAPADLWSRQKDSGASIASLFAEGGVYLTRLTCDRVEGWLRLKEWLKIREDGLPRLIIRRNCAHLIRCMPLLLFDENRPMDAAIRPHAITHAPDALRYFAVGVPCREPDPLSPRIRHTKNQTEKARIARLLHNVRGGKAGGDEAERKTP